MTQERELPTPRTNAITPEFGPPSHSHVTVGKQLTLMRNLARTLERESEAFRSKLAEQCGKTLVTMDQLSAANTALTSYKDRYLMLSAQHAKLCDQVYEDDGETLRQDALAECRQDALAECRKDAKRYRWLRDKSVPPHNFYLSVPIEFKDDHYTRQQVDAAIDAALLAQLEGK